ncbi:PREDICTED: protein ABIL3-like [Brassica oleracea var. oleracea]|uniref:protein ABIL3-like n=1 Tax=Brassica oleracea var. oleracea TaxID=109376 RepID=UPI0006A70F10|nr:PREDICTED: protein ABIL3-like [Brassica oleracea var. oleracea]
MTPLCNRVCYFLKDLKNLRTRLYSAVKYFELSYTNDGDTQSVVGTQKDYAIKALVNTADHLGSVTYEANEYVDEKVDQVAGTELRVACIDQVYIYQQTGLFLILLLLAGNQYVFHMTERVKRLLGGSLSRTSTIIC